MDDKYTVETVPMDQVPTTGGWGKYGALAAQAPSDGMALKVTCATLAQAHTMCHGIKGANRYAAERGGKLPYAGVACCRRGNVVFLWRETE